MQRLFPVWGETRYQRLLDWMLVWIKSQLVAMNQNYPSERIASIIAPMRELCDERGMRKLVVEGIYAVAFIRVMDMLYVVGGDEMLTCLEGLVSAGKLSNYGVKYVFVAFVFCVVLLYVRVLLKIQRAVVGICTYLYRQLIGSSWYERAINGSLLSGIACVVYLVFASGAIADADAFWFAPDPDVELMQLSDRLETRAAELLAQDENAPERKELLNLLHDAWREYDLAVERNDRDEITSAVTHLLEVSRLISDKEHTYVFIKRSPPNTTPTPKEEPKEEPQPKPRAPSPGSRIARVNPS
jgi:hypothetical protein